MVIASRFAIGKVGGSIPPLATVKKAFQKWRAFLFPSCLNKHENICKMEEYL